MKLYEAIVKQHLSLVLQMDKTILRIRTDLSISNPTVDANITHFSMQVGYPCATETATDCITTNIRNRVEQCPNTEDKGGAEDIHIKK